MITAIVHIDCETNQIPEVAERLANLDGVSEVYSVAGSVDLIAIVRVVAFDDIASVIAGAISKTPGVVNTETHLAFRAYSRHDLDALKEWLGEDSVRTEGQSGPRGATPLWTWLIAVAALAFFFEGALLRK